MSKNNLISVNCFDTEIGILGLDEQKNKSFFQFNPQFLESGRYANLFPVKAIIKRRTQTQVFSNYNNECFRGLPPMFADSLPDTFGNIIFGKWLESRDNEIKKISPLEQLAYVGKRGMGALEYLPAKVLPEAGTINLEEIISVLDMVLNQKETVKHKNLNHESLLNIFKIGSSAGGARPKILISENKSSGVIIPGDLVYSEDHNHYLVKLSLDDPGYSPELIEFSYYLTATKLGINMMPSKMIDDKHFATLRFDRVDGKKKHTQTVSGLSSWDFSNPDVSTYENLFELSVYLNIPQKDIEELYRRMIFNLIFSNRDDHLKNHSFIYNENKDSWRIAPAYDLTYSINPLLNFKKTTRALSINSKRTNIQLADLLKIADNFTIKHPQKIIEECINHIEFWKKKAEELGISEKIIQKILDDFTIPA